MKRKILLIYTGGTIGMTKDYSDNSLRPFDFKNISQQIPELRLIDADLQVISFEEPLDSSDITPRDWKKIAETIQFNYDSFDGFIVLHGTDTMSYSAAAMSFILEGLQKPVIFTGSQLPIGDLRTDARENLISSIHFATLVKDGQPVIREVCIYFEYKLYRANRTTKLNAHHFDAFKSPNYPELGESGVHMYVNHQNLWHNEQQELKLQTHFSENVALLKIFPGMSDVFLEQILQTPNTKALIIEAFGSGNIFNREKFNNLLKQKAKEGLILIVSSQCLGGSVELGMYSASQIFVETEALSARDMTTETAVVKTMFLLENAKNRMDFNEKFSTNLRGECSTIENNFS
ncbi:MAG: asparaginase [Flavobacteriaceae bacterium]|nr:asparaginase [Flavobacteriaceae bacterium]